MFVLVLFVHAVTDERAADRADRSADESSFAGAAVRVRADQSTHRRPTEAADDRAGARLRFAAGDEKRSERERCCCAFDQCAHGKPPRRILDTQNATAFDVYRLDALAQSNLK